LTSNDPTSIIENAISLELGLYCSNHYRENCRCTISATVMRFLEGGRIVTPGVLQSSPFKKSRPEIYEGREVHQNTKNGHMDHFFGLNSTK
jgi:hypothetical protein